MATRSLSKVIVLPVLYWFFCFGWSICLYTYATSSSPFLPPLPMSTLVDPTSLSIFATLQNPLFSGASGGLRWICPNQLSQGRMKFYSIATTPTLSHIT
jgi:hypothetical protein